MENGPSFPREMEEDDRHRLSFASVALHPRSSIALSRGVVAPAIRNPDNVFEDPLEPPTDNDDDDDEPENVFATPTNSRRSSSSGFQGELGAGSTVSSPSSSTHRSSLALSVPRSPSLMSVADGWGGHHGVFRRSISLTRSVTPSLSAASGSVGLRRSNTANTANTHTTSNSSTLYSMPSHTSGLSSPPSPIHSIAPVRPRFDYSGHQQTLSVDGSSVDIGDPDPFSDGLEVPVTDGFAPRAPRPVASSAASHTGSFGSLPPPYTQYPGYVPPKPEDSEIDLGVAAVAAVDPTAPLADSDVSTGDDEGIRRRRAAAVAAVAAAAAAAAAAAPGAGATGGANSGGDADGDPSGAVKEWREKRFLGGRPWLMVLSGLAALLLGVALGLGVGLGIGLKRGSKLR